MKTSAIDIPPDTYFIRIFDWQMKALKNECASKILSILMWHYDNRYENLMLKELLDRAYRKNNGRIMDYGDWMPYSVAYLRKCLLNANAPGTIINALDLIEAFGWVDSNVPEDIRAFYAGNMKWYKLEVDRINLWLDENIPRNFQQKKVLRSEPKIITSSVTDKPKTNADVALQLCEFHRHVHGKMKTYLYDAADKKMITDFLKIETVTIGHCAMAIIGNVLSKYHQGENDNGKVYDTIFNIFNGAKRFQNHLGYAEDGKVTEEIANNEFQAFLEGRASRYTKKPKNTVKNDLQAKETAIDHKALAPFRHFFKVVFSQFHSKISNADILDECINNPQLGKGRELVDAGLIITGLKESSKLFYPEGLPDGITESIGKFANRFAAYNKTNGVK